MSSANSAVRSPRLAPRLLESSVVFLVGEAEDPRIPTFAMLVAKGGLRLPGRARATLSVHSGDLDNEDGTTEPGETDRPRGRPPRPRPNDLTSVAFSSGELLILDKFFFAIEQCKRDKTCKMR